MARIVRIIEKVSVEYQKTDGTHGMVVGCERETLHITIEIRFGKVGT